MSYKSSNLKDCLNYVLTNIKPKNHIFLLDFINQNITLQIIHRSYVDILRHEDDSFGLALHLAFSPSTKINVENFERFKRLIISKQFKSYYFDDTPCFAIDLGDDVEKTTKLTNQLLKDVYGLYDLSTLKIEVSDEGPV